MKTLCFSRFLSVCFAMAPALIDPNGAELSPKDGADVQAGLAAGLEDWQSRIAFRSEFTVQIGSAAPFDSSRIEDARFDPKAEIIEAHGILNKRGQVVHSRYDFVKSWVPFTQPLPDGQLNPGGLAFQFVPRDEVATGDVCLVYIKACKRDQRTLGNQVNVQAREPQFRNGPFVNRTQWIDPLSLGVISVRRLFDLDPMSIGDNEISRHVSKGADGRINVVVDASKSGISQHRELSFKMWGATPLLERRVDRSTTTAGTSEEQVVFTDYHSCDGGCAARKVIATTHSWVATSKRETFALTKWVSEDLGNQSPTDEDFIVTVPESATVIGTNDVPPASDGMRRFDIRKFTEAEVWPAVKAPAAKSSGDSTKFPWTHIVVVNIVICSLFVLVFWRMRRRKRGPIGPTGLVLVLCVVVPFGCHKVDAPRLDDGSIVVSKTRGPVFTRKEGLSVDEVFAFHNPLGSPLTLKTGHKSCTCLDYEVLTPVVAPYGVGRARVRMVLYPLSGSKAAGVDFDTDAVSCPQVRLRLTCHSFPRLTYRCEDRVALPVSPGAQCTSAFTAVTNEPVEEPRGEFSAMIQSSDLNVVTAVGKCQEEVIGGVRHCERRVQVTLTSPREESERSAAISQSGYSANVTFTSGAERLTVPVYWRAVQHIAVEPPVVLLSSAPAASPSCMVHLKGDRAFRICEAKSSDKKIKMEVDYQTSGPEHDIRVTIAPGLSSSKCVNRTPIEIVTDHPEQRTATLTVLEMPN